MSTPNDKPLRFISVKPNYRMSDYSRDISPEGLAFLYTLADLDMMYATPGSDCLKTCMLLYFEDGQCINRKATEIFADVAIELGKPVKVVSDGIESAMDRMWQGYKFFKLSEKYGIDQSLDFKEKPKTVELIRVFCEFAWKNYQSFENGKYK